MVQYLLRNYGKRRNRTAAHVWEGSDTLCRLYSSGGLVQRTRYRVASSPEGRPLCTMCLAEQLARHLAEAAIGA